MARELYGTISWTENPIYSALTPVRQYHLEELETYISKVQTEFDNHKAENSYDAHKAVSLTESGFITPEIVSEILGLQDKLDAIKGLLDSRVPDGIIVPWNGLPSDPPEAWKWCNGDGMLPDTRNRFILGGSNSTTYRLHSEVNASNWAASLGTTTALAAHTHTFYNAYFAEHQKYYNPSSCVNRTPFGLTTLGSGDSDTDNSLMYYANDYFDYAGSNADTSASLGEGLPQYIKYPFIMKTVAHEGVTCSVQIVDQPSHIKISVDGSNSTAAKTVPWGTIISVTASIPTGYELISCTINGISATPPFNYCVMSDTVILAEEREKICNLQVKQSSYGSTTVNNVKISSQNYTYGTSLKVQTTPNSTYKFTSYTVQFNGYTPKTVSTQAVSTYGLMTAALMAYEDDADFLADYEAAKVNTGAVPAEDENINEPIAVAEFEGAAVNASIGQTKSKIISTTVNITEAESYRLFNQNIISSNFYGNHDGKATVTLTLSLDGVVLGSQTLTYIDGGERAVELIDKNVDLSAGTHRFDLKIEAHASVANLDASVTTGKVEIKPVGNQDNVANVDTEGVS